eukprot:scaffold39311_cov32-Tisochrysis_lutea.AAC.7
MKAQLNDTSNITVDLDNFAGASQAAVAHSSRSIIDPYLAPPSLEFVPAELLARPCFKSAGGAASPKRRRSSISTRASLGERPPTTSGIAAGEEGQVVEERSPQADIFAPEELPQYFGVEQDPYLPFDDQPPFETSGMQEGSVEFEPPADEPSSARRRSRHAAEAFPLPPSFAAATALPEVDASASAHPIDSGGSSQVSAFLVACNARSPSASANAHWRWPFAAGRHATHLYDLAHRFLGSTPLRGQLVAPHTEDVQRAC